MQPSASATVAGEGAPAPIPSMMTRSSISRGAWHHGNRCLVSPWWFMPCYFWRITTHECGVGGAFRIMVVRVGRWDRAIVHARPVTRPGRAL